MIVMVHLKKTLTLYFSRLCLYCSLNSLMHDKTTLGHSINFSVDGFGFLLGFALLTEICRVVFVL